MVTENDCLYFAYGQDLVEKLIQKRLPSAQFVATCSLRDYELGFFGPDTQPSVYRSPGDQVCGVLWRLSPADHARLQLHYKRYRPVEVVVSDVDDPLTTYRCVLYALAACQQRVPAPAPTSPGLKPRRRSSTKGSAPRQKGTALWVRIVMMPRIDDTADADGEYPVKELLEPELLLVD